MQALARIARPALTSKALPIRTFTTLSPLRPSLSRPARTALLLRFTPPASPSAVDVVAPGAVSAHPALAGGAAQIRCGPRNTMNGATRLVQKRRHGYLARTRSRTGRAILKRRRQKRRAKLGCH